VGEGQVQDDDVDALGNERRRFRRFPIEGTVRLFSPTAMWSSALIDLSLRGVLIERPADWTGTPGQRYRLDLRLEGGVMIGMGTTLARICPDALGFNCEKIDLDSFSRLKRMVELNLGNSDVLNRELSTLGT
jgi:hypothetical protein